MLLLLRTVYFFVDHLHPVSRLVIKSWLFVWSFSLSGHDVDVFTREDVSLREISIAAEKFPVKIR